MAVFPSRLSYPAKYAREGFSVLDPSYDDLLAGEFVSSGLNNGYGVSYDGLEVYCEEEIWDDRAGDYIHEGVDNCVAIEVDASGLSKLIITARTNHSREDYAKVGWSLSPDWDEDGEFTMLTNTAFQDFEFDISGQSTIYIKVYSRYRVTYVTHIRLE